MKPCKTCKEFSCGANGSDYVSMRCGSEEGFIRAAADSLPNAAELVEELRGKANLVSYYNRTIEKYETVEREAADAIEQLVSKCNHLAEENAKLKAERNAAVTDLQITAFNCSEDYVSSACFCCDFAETCNGNSANGCTFEWRGVKKEEEDVSKT